MASRAFYSHVFTALLVVLLSCVPAARADVPVGGFAFDGPVTSIATAPDGSAYLGGEFTEQLPPTGGGSDPLRDGERDAGPVAVPAGGRNREHGDRGRQRRLVRRRVLHGRRADGRAQRRAHHGDGRRRHRVDTEPGRTGLVDREVGLDGVRRWKLRPDRGSGAGLVRGPASRVRRADQHPPHAGLRRPDDRALRFDALPRRKVHVRRRAVAEPHRVDQYEHGCGERLESGGRRSGPGDRGLRLDRLRGR